MKILNKLEKYSDLLQEILTVCKINNINANMKRIQIDIKRGINKDFIINNLDCYI